MTGLVAHNSYVHCFVELGFIGGTFFFGCFFLTIWALYRTWLGQHHLLSPELRRMLPYIAAIMTAWCVGMLSLSRCYAPSTYMIAGLGAAYVNLAGYYRRRPQALVEFTWPTIQTLTACSCGLLIASYAAVKVLARFGG